LTIVHHEKVESECLALQNLSHQKQTSQSCTEGPAKPSIFTPDFKKILVTSFAQNAQDPLLFQVNPNCSLPCSTAYCEIVFIYATKDLLLMLNHHITLIPTNLLFCAIWLNGSVPTTVTSALLKATGPVKRRKKRAKASR
jgi:hypothetical protein